MPRKIRMLLSFTLAMAFLAAGVTIACADDECPSNFPYNIGTFDDFLTDTDYFNSISQGGADVFYNTLTNLDFKGLWYVAVIAGESGIRNKVKYRDTVIIDKSDCTTRGYYTLVDFDNYNLVFDNISQSINLDPFTGQASFRVVQLTQDSNDLSYLTYKHNLKKGDIIVGFEDWTDNDHDDLIIAMRALKTSEDPRYDPTVTNSESTFDGEGFCYEWIDRTTCNVIVTDCLGNEIPGTPLNDIEDEFAEGAVFFGVSGADCKVVYLRFGDNTTRCAIIRGIKYCK